MRQSFKRGEVVDASLYGGTTLLSTNPEFIETTTTGSYRLYSGPTKYRTKYMYKGVDYDGMGVLKVTDTSGDALSKGIVSLIF